MITSRLLAVIFSWVFALYPSRPHDGGRRRAPRLGCWMRGGGETLPTSTPEAGYRGTTSTHEQELVFTR